MQISYVVTARLMSTFVFASLIVRNLFLNPKFHASSIYCYWTDQFVANLVCPKPQGHVFSSHGSNQVRLMIGITGRMREIILPLLRMMLFYHASYSFINTVRISRVQTRGRTVRNISPISENLLKNDHFM